MPQLLPWGRPGLGSFGGGTNGGGPGTHGGGPFPGLTCGGGPWGGRVGGFILDNSLVNGNQAVIVYHRAKLCVSALMDKGKFTDFECDPDQKQITIARHERQDLLLVLGDEVAFPFRTHQDFLLARFGLGARCDNALPAAVLLALLVRPSRRTFDAAFAAFALVRR